MSKMKKEEEFKTGKYQKKNGKTLQNASYRSVSKALKTCAARFAIGSLSSSLSNRKSSTSRKISTSSCSVKLCSGKSIEVSRAKERELIRASRDESKSSRVEQNRQDQNRTKRKRAD